MRSLQSAAFQSSERITEFRQGPVRIYLFTSPCLLFKQKGLGQIDRVGVDPHHVVAVVVAVVVVVVVVLVAFVY